MILGLLISLFFGFIPVFFFAYIIYWIDRYEKEPKLLLFANFLWGAIISAGFAFFVNTTLGLGVYLFSSSESLTDFTTGSLIAPIVEESAKGLAVLIVFLARRREFDSILDGIIYAAITALGFAATENTYYIYNYGYLENGLQGIMWLTFVRVILVGWQHPFYTAFIGIGLAVARLSRNDAIRILAPFIGWSMSVLTHSFHNTLSSLLQGLGGLLLGTLFDWSGWFFMGLFILWALRREQRWISRHLSEEATLGTITFTQYRVACSAWAQTVARFQGLLNRRYHVTNRFYHLAAELAFKKEHHSIHGEEKENAIQIERLRNELRRLAVDAQT
jgi:RsiW-degrading membrane proteinase PrsW (M82 family)